MPQDLRITAIYSA